MDRTGYPASANYVVDCELVEGMFARLTTGDFPRRN